MMSARSDRGAVHILVLVVTLIIGLIGWVVWYQAYTENEVNKEKVKKLTESAEMSNSDYVNVKMAYDDLAAIVGGLQPMTATADQIRSTPEDWKKAYTGWHKPIVQKVTEEVTFFSGDKSITTLTGAFLPAEAKVTALQAEVDGLKRDLATARTDADGARRSNTTLADQNNTALNTKNQEIAANRERLENQLADSEKKKEDVSKELNRVAQEFNAAVAKAGEEVRKLKASFEGYDREVTVLKANLPQHRVPETPDGKIIEVDQRAGLCWIDLGSNHALRRGTVFTVYGLLKGNVKDEHGRIRVHDISVDRALCAIEGPSNIRSGDFIENVFYDRNGAKTFYFLGKLPGRFDNQTAKNILEDFDAKVTDKLSIHVDFIVLGDDPNPEVTPETMSVDWFKDAPEYNDALRWGIQTIRARDLETYLQF